MGQSGGLPHDLAGANVGADEGTCQYWRVRHLTPRLLLLTLLVVPVSLAAKEAAPGRMALINAIREHRAALERVLEFDEAALERARHEADKRIELLARGMVSRREVEESERVHAEAERKFLKTRGELRNTSYMLEEALAPQRGTGRQAWPPGSAPLLEHHRGPARWSLAEAPKIQTFFERRFGRPLPVSAFGQTPLHDRLGFDHRDALDVAVLPDSAEGVALMTYLRNAGFSFLAYRAGAPGEATGAHIHVGEASRKF